MNEQYKPRAEEISSLHKVVTDYAYALDVLDQYDHQVLQIKDMMVKVVVSLINGKN